MFGYVTASPDGLSQEARERYEAVYCGLCKALGKRHGPFGRLALNYDMVFLIMVLDSLYEPESCSSCGRCFIHPVHPRGRFRSEITDYAADMDVALAYLNLLDDWEDDRNIISLAGAKLLKRGWMRAQENWPHQCGVITEKMSELRELEQSGGLDPDRGTVIFGELLAEIFIYRQDRWEPLIRGMAGSLGRFIYIMDAAIDLDKDIRKGSYNPLIPLRDRGRDDEYFRELLTILLGECTMAFDRLPLVENTDIMRNILCSGVWSRFEQAQARKQKKMEKRR